MRETIGECKLGQADENAWLVSILGIIHFQGSGRVIFVSSFTLSEPAFDISSLVVERISGEIYIVRKRQRKGGDVRVMGLGRNKTWSALYAGCFFDNA